MSIASCIFSVILGWWVIGVNSIGLIKPIFQETPEPGLACSTVNRLNIRSGPGKNYGVVGTLLNEHCSSYLGKNADGTWIQIEEGWVFAEYVTLELNPKIPTTLENSEKSEGESTRATEVTTTTVEIGSKSPLPFINIPVISDLIQSLPILLRFTNIKEYFLLLNPSEQFVYGLQLMYVIGAFYVGLVGVRKFTLLRWIISCIVLVASAYILITYMLERPNLYIMKSRLPSLEMTAIAIVIAYVVSSAIGKIIYRGPSKKEFGANTRCSVCGQMQRSSRMARCAKCNGWYCNFPLWQDRSIRRVFDGIALIIAIPVFIILTAFSILGGIIAMFFLSIPYFVVRELFPESQMPSYWKNCGNGSFCYRCDPPSYSSSSGSDNDSSGGYTSDCDDRGRFDNDNNDRGDGDKGGSIWDGWAQW